VSRQIEALIQHHDATSALTFSLEFGYYWYPKLKPEEASRSVVGSYDGRSTMEVAGGKYGEGS
jgi:hypothetical protein